MLIISIKILHSDSITDPIPGPFCSKPTTSCFDSIMFLSSVLSPPPLATP